MGLVLLSGFCPSAPVGLSLSALLRGTSGRYAAQWDLPGYPPAEWVLEQVSIDPNYRLLRLDGLTLSDQNPGRQLYRQPLQKFQREINTMIPEWVEYKDASTWQVPKANRSVAIFRETRNGVRPISGFAKN